MTIKAIITDYGGVLVKMVDEAPRHRLAEKVGMPLSDIYHLVFDSTSSIQASLGEITYDQHWENVRDGMGLPPAELQDFIDRFWSADRLNTELVDYLRSRRSRFRIGLLSNAADDLRSKLIDLWKIADLFDHMVISAEVHQAKPDARIYRLACARLDVQPGEAIFIDDMPENVEGARLAGLHPIQYRSNEQLIAEIKKILKQG